MIKKIKTGIALLASTLFISGCDSFEKIFEDIMQKDYKTTKEQASVATVQSLRNQYTKVVDGKTVFNYEAIQLEDKLKSLNEMKKNLDELANQKDQKNREYVENFPKLKDHLAKKSKIIEYKVSRYSLVMLHNKFLKFLGVATQPQKPLSDYEILFQGNNLPEKLSFTAKYVEDSRSNNTLKTVEQVVLEHTFQIEEENPDYPLKDPNNKTKKVEKRVVLSITGYDTNDNSLIDYVELHRFKKDGTEEKLPALKLFKSSFGENPTILVVDKDIEGAQGNGVIDEVETVFSVRTVMELYNQTILQKIYSKEELKKENIPEIKERSIEILKVGDLKPKQSQMSDKGWVVPIDYKFFNSQNYTILVKKNEKKEIEFIAKKYNVDGRVVEFYKPKVEYSKQVADFNVEDNKKTLELILEDKPAIKQKIDFFIEREPYKIDYDLGNSRFSIEDKDNKEPKYEQKTEETKPNEINVLEGKKE